VRGLPGVGGVCLGVLWLAALWWGLEWGFSLLMGCVSGIFVLWCLLSLWRGGLGVIGDGEDAVYPFCRNFFFSFLSKSECGIALKAGLFDISFFFFSFLGVVVWVALYVYMGEDVGVVIIQLCDVESLDDFYPPQMCLFGGSCDYDGYKNLSCCLESGVHGKIKGVELTWRLLLTCHFR
jgi:hypothetical protein